LLRVRDLTRRFGGVTAVNAVSFDVRAGEIFALIGPNGAGKTTCFNMISGVLAPSAGSVRLGDTRIDGKKPHVFAGARATRTFQNLQIFRSTTVRGNVAVARHLRSSAGMLRGALHVPARAEERQIQRSVDEVLALTGLAADADRPAADLSFGRQRQLEIARALALEPDLLLLDEPMAGLSGAERQSLVRLLRRLRAGGMAIVLVEHDVEAVLALADRVAVLDDGHLIALGPPDEVRQDPAVLAAYLGVDDDEGEPVAPDGEPVRKDGA
jgi:branched-chain amino acid transport system permease protein